jgi:hypothetical protein
MKPSKIKKKEAELIIAQFVNLFISPDRDDVRKLFHNDGCFFGGDKEGSGRIIKIISEADQLEFKYCRYFFKKCKIKNSTFTHTIKILYLNRQDFYDTCNPSFKSNSSTFGENNTRNFWLNFNEKKIFEISTNQNKLFSF